MNIERSLKIDETFNLKKRRAAPRNGQREKFKGKVSFQCRDKKSCKHCAKKPGTCPCECHQQERL